MKTLKLTMLSAALMATASIALASTEASSSLEVISSGNALQVVCVPDEKANCAWSVGISSDRGYIWLGKAVQENTELARSEWSVTDKLSYPEISAGYEFSDVMCRYNERFDQTIIAVVKAEKAEWLKASGWAYRADPATGKFEKLDPSSVDCYNDTGMQ